MDTISANKDIKAEICKYVVLLILIIVFYFTKDNIPNFNLLLYITLLIFGYVASLSDLKRKIVSNRLIKYMLLFYLIFISVYLIIDTEIAFLQLKYSLLGFLFAFIILISIYIISKQGIGGADVKFMSVAGLYVGTSSILNAMLYGSIVAGIVGVTLILLKKIEKKDTIPLIPFLYFGLVLELFIK